MKSKKYKIKFLLKQKGNTGKHTAPLSIIHDRPSTWMITFSRTAIVATIFFWLLYIISTIIRYIFESPSFLSAMEAAGYLTVVTFLTLSSFMYLVARQGAFQHFAKHKRISRAELDRYFSKNQPSITILVPSYNEDIDVIRKTLISAALQEYPNKRIVLLIDNNPYPSSIKEAEVLDDTRNLNKDIMKLFSKPRTRFKDACKKFENENSRSATIKPNVTKRLAEHYIWAAGWLNRMADQEEVNDHVDTFFKEQIFDDLARELKLVGNALVASCDDGAKLSFDQVKQLYHRLIWIFDAEISVFERKKYTSLSHEANKAMNLNSYIGLMGKSYHCTQTPDGAVLVPTANPKSGDLKIPDSDFLLTLDADSVLLRDYCLRLVYLLERPDNSRVAVAQTPYSSFHGATNRIEQIAGATTDIQHIIHQGMSRYDATFWVGANAILRKSALEDIVESEWIGEFEIFKYIQDRTVIEDTESSIDLVSHGWTLTNYPERLSYSATPPDFGSLIVQRRRWANGGLLIVPKLWRHIRHQQHNNKVVSRTEILLRLNYMASIAWSNFSLIFLLAYPLNEHLLSPFMVLAALPYFLAMSVDLKYCGYKRSDVFWVYGFNMILLPINIAGVLKSLQQALTGKKIPFHRTPKIKNRTTSSLFFVIMPVFIVWFSLHVVKLNIINQNWGNAAFAGFNALSTLLAIFVFIGFRNLVVDAWRGVIDWLYVETKDKTPKTSDKSMPKLDWRAVLYHGDTKGTISVAKERYHMNFFVYDKKGKDNK